MEFSSSHHRVKTHLTDILFMNLSKLLVMQSKLMGAATYCGSEFPKLFMSCTFCPKYIYQLYWMPPNFSIHGGGKVTSIHHA